MAQALARLRPVTSTKNPHGCPAQSHRPSSTSPVSSFITCAEHHFRYSCFHLLQQLHCTQESYLPIQTVLCAAAAKSLQSYPTLCDPIDGSPPGSPIPGILQARTLEWVAISFSNAWKRKVKVKVKSLSRVRLFETPWTTAYQAPPSVGFSRQEYWSRVPLPSPKLSSVDKDYSLAHQFYKSPQTKGGSPDTERGRG